MSGQSPPIKHTQLEMLRSLLNKRGWSDKDFARHAKKNLTTLSQAEARVWITRLTNETRGKSSNQRPRRVKKQPHIPRSSERHQTEQQPAPTPVPAVAIASPQEIDQACEIICQRLELNRSLSEGVISKTLQDVGIKTGLLALEQAIAQRNGSNQPTNHFSSLWRLTPLELWVNLARAFHNA